MDMSYDGLVGVTAAQDRTIYVWDMQRGEAIREIKIQCFVQKVALTAMAKFIAATLLDGTLILYETVTGIIWRSEKVDGKHSGVGIGMTNYLMELAREGQEHRMMAFLDKHAERL